MTPYYASLLDPDAPDQGLRRCVIPSASESLFSTGESVDPLGEEHDSPTPGLVHRYPNRVLFLVTDFCSTYCRYCTRSRGMGGAGDIGRLRHRWEKALAYIEATPAVQDVLLSGGDALTLPDEALEWLLARVSRIPHVEFVRIGTKVPAVLPQRITKSLTRMLRKYHPLWMSLHFTHPDELTPESAHACAMLADAGIPLGSQTVLLAGVNDNAPTMKSLFQGLLKQRVRPYYLYQCDPIAGSAHFRTPVATGVEIMRALRGKVSGYAMPTYVIDAPGGGGQDSGLPGLHHRPGERGHPAHQFQRRPLPLPRLHPGRLHAAIGCLCPRGLPARTHPGFQRGRAPLATRRGSLVTGPHPFKNLNHYLRYTP